MVNNKLIADLRRDYRSSELLESQVDSDPLQQFMRWFDQALQAEINEPNAMSLGTIRDGKPESRIVLLKGMTEQGFVFYTNYNSDKGKEIAGNHHVSLNFVWLELERQVRITGIAEKVSTSESDQYFYSRPLGSQIGAIVSAQSEELSSRKELEDAMAAAEERYKHEVPLRPAHWGGYCIVPDMVEFWQGRSSRLHDRLRYEMKAGKWLIRRLYP